MSAKARTLLAAATERPEAEIPKDAAIGTFEAWDSLAHIRLFAALEQELGRETTPEEAVSITSLDTLQAVLDAKGAPGQ
ncbi:acyl carrier protein [Rhodobacteraceae bacterium NNCM2]|nr:acyl carrier protein [Coraliihabitans acroporae]